MLFFQVVLFAGYMYAHLTTQYLTPRKQALLHVGLLIVAACLLPITPAESWKPTADVHPTGRILFLLTACVGLPYFILSSTGPLLQRWFSLQAPGQSPYRLYALSNIGSLLALVSSRSSLRQRSTHPRRRAFGREDFEYSPHVALCVRSEFSGTRSMQ
jgi:hypothetical protein